jgi:hypothetical protein
MAMAWMAEGEPLLTSLAGVGRAEIGAWSRV